jgi:hypothetical protein
VTDVVAQQSRPLADAVPTGIIVIGDRIENALAVAMTAVMAAHQLHIDCAVVVPKALAEEGLRTADELGILARLLLFAIDSQGLRGLDLATVPAVIFMRNGLIEDAATNITEYEQFAMRIRWFFNDNQRKDDTSTAVLDRHAAASSATMKEEAGS